MTTSQKVREDIEAMRVSFLKAAHKFFLRSPNAPVTLKYTLSTGGKMTGYTEGLLWGCPQMNFKANPPFNEMRQDFAIFKKETRMAPRK